MIFCKYSFPQGVWDQLKPIITKDEQYVDCAVVELSSICIAKDEEGNCTQYDPNTAVDIMWFNEVPSEFATYEVFPNPCGVHVFAGCEDLYLNRFCEFNPDSPHCKPLENQLEN